jgi:hypothetical protein
MNENARLEVVNELDTYILGGRSLTDWHDFLTTDHYTGQPNGHEAVTGSRYGRDGSEAALWAIAAQAAYSYATRRDEDMEQGMDHFMSLAANDDPSLVILISEFRWVVPTELDEMLDWDQAIASHI